MLYMAVRFCNPCFHQPRTLGTHRDWIGSWIMDHAPLAGPSAERICTWRKSNHDFKFERKPEVASNALGEHRHAGDGGL
jgi:hypothetical protein